MEGLAVREHIYKGRKAVHRGKDHGDQTERALRGIAGGMEEHAQLVKQIKRHEHVGELIEELVRRVQGCGRIKIKIKHVQHRKERNRQTEEQAASALCVRKKAVVNAKENTRHREKRAEKPQSVREEMLRKPPPPF